MTVKDRIALDLRQIELVIRIEMLKALQQAPGNVPGNRNEATGEKHE